MLLKCLFIIFSLNIKNLDNCYRKHKEKLWKRYQNFSGEKKTKSANMLMSDIEIFLKKKKKRSVNMVVNYIKNIKRMKKKG